MPNDTKTNIKREGRQFEVDAGSVTAERSVNVYTRIFDSDDDPSTVKSDIEGATRGSSFKFGSGVHDLSGVAPIDVPSGATIEGQQSGLEVSDGTLWADDPSNTVTAQGTVLKGDTSVDCFTADSLDSFAIRDLAFRDWASPINLGSGNGVVQLGTLDNLYVENTAASAINLNNILYLSGRHWQMSDAFRIFEIENSHDNLNMGNTTLTNIYGDKQDRTGASDGAVKIYSSQGSNTCNMLNINRLQARNYTNPTAVIHKGCDIVYSKFMGLNLESSTTWEIQGAGNFSQNWVSVQFGALDFKSSKAYNNYFFHPKGNDPEFNINDGTRNWIYCESWDPALFSGTDRQFVWADGGLYDGSTKLFDLDGWKTYPPLSAAPSNPSAGQTALADGTNWDPDSDGDAEIVVYNGTSWVEDTDLGTAL